LLTKVRTLIHEEISLFTVLKFPFRVRTPTRTSLVLLYSAKGFHQLPLTNHSSLDFTAAAVLPPEPLAALRELIEHPS
jgi:hypothetical protein